MGAVLFERHLEQPHWCLHGRRLVDWDSVGGLRVWGCVAQLECGCAFSLPGHGMEWARGAARRHPRLRGEAGGGPGRSARASGFREGVRMKRFSHCPFLPISHALHAPREALWAHTSRYGKTPRPTSGRQQATSQDPRPARTAIPVAGTRKKIKIRAIHKAYPNRANPEESVPKSKIYLPISDLLSPAAA